MTDTVIISRGISVGSCTFNRYFELDGVMCIGGVREGEGARLARAVGDGRDDAGDVEGFDTTAHMRGRVRRGLV